MNVDNIYDSDTGFEDLVYSSKNIQVVYFDNSEQFKQTEKNSIKLVVLTTTLTPYNIS